MRKIPVVLLWMMLSSMTFAQSTSNSGVQIPLYSQSLAKKIDPSDRPFVAVYHYGNKLLAFVAASHVFTVENQTVEAVRYAFSTVQPTAVVVEGFPTAMGANPEPIMESIEERRRPHPSDWARSEAVFAASQALARQAPFVGGEPTLVEELDGLTAKGYRRDDALLAFRLRSLGQARRASDLPVGDAAKFAAIYEQSARVVASLTSTAPVFESNFIEDYKRLVGVDPVTDPDLATRADPGTTTLLSRLSADDMRVRDEHILSTLQRQLAEHDRVVIVYGRGHWTTLSAALRERFGAPDIHVPSKRRN